MADRGVADVPVNGRRRRAAREQVEVQAVELGGVGLAPVGQALRAAKRLEGDQEGGAQRLFRWGVVVELGRRPVLVFGNAGLETVPDAGAFARMAGTPDIETAEAEEQMGERFQKLPLHSIVCIGALISERAGAGWTVRSLGAPHVGERSEGELIQGFVDRIGELRAQLVSFNGHGFDLPVLRYRAMLNGIHAPALGRRPYFNRFTDDALDLCDALASFDARSRLSLDGLARFLGLAGKPAGIDGSMVAGLVKEGRIQEVADYCENPPSWRPSRLNRVCRKRRNPARALRRSAPPYGRGLASWRRICRLGFRFWRRGGRRCAG